MSRGTPAGKHRAQHRAPRRIAPAVPFRRVAMVTAPMVTTLAVGAGVTMAGAGSVTGVVAASDDASPRQETAAAAGLAQDVTRPSVAAGSPTLDRTLAVSRSAERTAHVQDRPLEVQDRRWTTTELDLRLAPGQRAGVDGSVPADKQVGITGREENGFAEVVIEGEPRWVTAEYLSEERDPANAPMGTSSCSGTSGVESGLTSDAVQVYRAVCNAFPEITTYGGYDNHGEHTSGRAIDIMVSDADYGTRIAEFLRSHASDLDLYDVIWRQRIWTPVRSSEGWRSMSDRGSSTANHYDHVHVSVN